MPSSMPRSVRTFILVSFTVIYLTPYFASEERSKGRLKKMDWTKRGYRRIVVKGGMVLHG